jgi:DNA polymerase I-like protein with 3'-5' exonuclease and polymerase domains
MTPKVASKFAYKLFHEGLRALAVVEEAGIKIDTSLLKKTTKDVHQSIAEKTAALKQDPVYKIWRKRYGEKTNLGSRSQLSEVLFNCMGIEKPQTRTATGRDKADEDTLERVQLDFVKEYISVEKLKKLHSTYLLGVAKHISPDGFLRPSFGLNIPRTYRGSSSDPNFQNIPIRDPEIGKLIRSCFTARDGRQLLENDFKGIEVNVAACYHKDPTMLRYLAEGYDMHKAMAGECFKIPEKDVPKPARQQAKSFFVFAEFYGDYYISVAKNLWDAIDRHKLTTLDGTPLKEWMRSRNIYERGACEPRQDPRPNTFEAHIKKVEHNFWNKRFPVYTKWKEDWYAAYLKNGWFQTLTGFICQGVYKRNDVINYPIQGSAFHCLLWCLTELVKTLHKYKMKSLVVGQIHDSIISDIHPKEKQAFFDIMIDITQNRLPKAMPWIITQMEIEAELCPVGGSWYDKKEVKMVETV